MRGAEAEEEEWDWVWKRWLVAGGLWMWGILAIYLLIMWMMWLGNYWPLAVGPPNS
jgi:hypothetical protein